MSGLPEHVQTNQANDDAYIGEILAPEEPFIGGA